MLTRTDSKREVHLAGLVAYLDVELGVAKFQFSVCQQIYVWTSTPVSTIITLLGCIVAASETAFGANKDSAGSEKSTGSQERDHSSSAFTSHQFRQGASITLAALSAIFTIVRPHSQRVCAHEALLAIEMIGQKFDRISRSHSIRQVDKISSLEEIQHDLRRIKRQYTGPFMSIGMGCAMLYLRCFPAQMLNTRWKPIQELITPTA